MHISECDIIFISYDEPNADYNYSDLLSKAPWAKRVHGVKGSDSAHKAAANLSESDRFITIDGDNIVDGRFFDQNINISQDISKSVVSWSGKNIVNGLIYGNGGIKCWPKDLVLTMRTHENADPSDAANQIEFCWGIKYSQINEVFSTAHINASPLQAFRAGFREGVKMGLNEGRKVNKNRFKESVFKKNYDRLCIWQTVGSDVKNGKWAIYGSRLGCYMTNCTDWDYINVRDFDWINKYYDSHIAPFINDENIDIESTKLKKELQIELNIDIADMDAEQSNFFKKIYINHQRVEKKF